MKFSIYLNRHVFVMVSSCAKTKTLIRLRGCTGWFLHWLHMSEGTFSHYMAHILNNIRKVTRFPFVVILWKWFTNKRKWTLILWQIFHRWNGMTNISPMKGNGHSFNDKYFTNERKWALFLWQIMCVCVCACVRACACVWSFLFRIYLSLLHLVLVQYGGRKISSYISYSIVNIFWFFVSSDPFRIFWKLYKGL